MTTDSTLHIDAANTFDAELGGHGVPKDEVMALAPRLAPLDGRLRAWRAGETPSFLSLPFAAGIEALVQRGRDIARRYRRTVVFGIGGSSLGGEMLVRVLGRRPVRHGIDFYDNIDPTTLETLADTDWRETCLLVVSKSGNTAETLSQFLTVLPAMEKQLGAAGIRERVLVITENPRGSLHQLAQYLGIDVIPHPAVGGRYSVLSVVGLLPAAIAGVDIGQLLEGARRMADRCCLTDVTANPAYWNGAAQYLHAERGRTLSVHLAYADRLRTITRWFRQLWAESLGKRDAAGHVRGLTPVDAHGVTDQHSQLQLYLDGPDDKLFTFITSPELRTAGARIPNPSADQGAIAPLAGHTTGELFMAEFEATRATLTRHGRPNRTLSLPLNDAAAVGELIMLLEVETVVVAQLLGVDPFDQPAVEEGKVLAREYLSRGG